MGKELENAIDDAQKKLTAMADDLMNLEDKQDAGYNSSHKKPDDAKLVTQCRSMVQKLNCYLTELSEIRRGLNMQFNQSETIKIAKCISKAVADDAKCQIDIAGNETIRMINQSYSKCMQDVKVAMQTAEEKIAQAKMVEFQETEIFAVTVDGFLNVLEKHDVEPTEAIICSLIEAVSYFKWRKMGEDNKPKAKRI